MRVRILSHAPGRRLVVAASAGPVTGLAVGAGLLAVPALLALQAHGAAVPSPGVELPLLVALAGLARRGLTGQRVLLQDGDAWVWRGTRHWRLPARAVRRAALLEHPARLALEVRLPDDPTREVAGGWATLLTTPWDGWGRAGPLRAELQAALARLGLVR